MIEELFSEIRKHHEKLSLKNIDGEISFTSGYRHAGHMIKIIFDSFEYFSERNISMSLELIDDLDFHVRQEVVLTDLQSMENVLKSSEFKITIEKTLNVLLKSLEDER